MFWKCQYIYFRKSYVAALLLCVSSLKIEINWSLVPCHWKGWFISYLNKFEPMKAYLVCKVSPLRHISAAFLLRNGPMSFLHRGVTVLQILVGLSSTSKWCSTLTHSSFTFNLDTNPFYSKVSFLRGPPIPYRMSRYHMGFGNEVISYIDLLHIIPLYLAEEGFQNQRKLGTWHKFPIILLKNLYQLRPFGKMVPSSHFFIQLLANKKGLHTQIFLSLSRVQPSWGKGSKGDLF